MGQLGSYKRMRFKVNVQFVLLFLILSFNVVNPFHCHDVASKRPGKGRNLKPLPPLFCVWSGWLAYCTAVRVTAYRTAVRVTVYRTAVRVTAYRTAVRVTVYRTAVRVTAYCTAVFVFVIGQGDGVLYCSQGDGVLYCSQGDGVLYCSVWVCYWSGWRRIVLQSGWRRIVLQCLGLLLVRVTAYCTAVFGFVIGQGDGVLYYSQGDGVLYCSVWVCYWTEWRRIVLQCLGVLFPLHALLDKQTDRQTDRDRNRETETETERERDRQTDRDRDRQREREREYNKVQACLRLEMFYSTSSPILGLFQVLPSRNQ